MVEIYNQPWAIPRNETFFKIENILGLGSLLLVSEAELDAVQYYLADFKASLTASSSSWSKKPNRFEPMRIMETN